MGLPRPVLVHDGDCAFCATSARFAARALRRDPGDFAVEPWQHLDLDAYGLTAHACTDALQWVAADGTVSSAQDAVARCLLASRRWVRPVGAALLLPGVNAVAGVVYRWVSRSRHRLPGGSPACSPSPPPG